MAKDPTIKSDGPEGDALEGTHPAVPVHEGDDYVGDKQYKDNPDKESPDSVAQVEVLPEDK